MPRENTKKEAESPFCSTLVTKLHTFTSSLCLAEHRTLHQNVSEASCWLHWHLALRFSQRTLALEAVAAWVKTSGPFQRPEGEEHWEQNISGDHVGLSHWSISFVGTMDTMLAAAFHIWKPTELGTVDLSKKATELHWILNNTIKKPTSTSHCQLMSCQPSCASPDLQPQTFGQNKGPRDQSPNSCRQLKARFPSKHRRFD